MGSPEEEAASMPPAPCLPLTATLANGVEIPRMAVGTFRVTGDAAERVVQWALREGYRHIDTASIYKNETEIGRGLRASGVPRSSVFLTSKVSPYEHGYEAALAACQASLDRLGTDYLDLYLVHWPGVARKPPASAVHAPARMETWRALEKLYTEGKCRAVGVSNYTAAHLQHMLPLCHVKPMLNQVELHPLLPQRELRRFCVEHSIQVAAYSPLGTGELLRSPAVCQLAQSGRTPAQLLLNWGLLKDCVVIPKASSQIRLRENWGALGFQLSSSDVSSLDELEQDRHFCWSSETVA